MADNERQMLEESKGLTMRLSELRRFIFERTKRAFSQEIDGSPYDVHVNSPSLVPSNYDFEVRV